MAQARVRCGNVEEQPSERNDLNKPRLSASRRVRERRRWRRADVTESAEPDGAPAIWLLPRREGPEAVTDGALIRRLCFGGQAGYSPAEAGDVTGLKST